MADRDWDLGAVVRSWVPAAASSSTAPRPAAADIHNHSNPPASSSATASLANFPEDDEVGCAHQSFIPFRFPSLTEPRTGFDELHQLYMPFLPRVDEKPNTLGLRACRAGPGLAPKRIGVTPAPASSAPIVDEKKQQMMMHGQVLQLHQNSTAAPQQTPRTRKRKSQQKKNVCHVSAENLSSDLWAWRKYGQKPIKGSPYPRNYYRCSSSKGCGARKQVERSNVDPNMFIVTYTGEHTHPRPTHRNSLAGSTRNKFTGALQKAQSASHPDDPGTKPATLSPTTPLTAPIDEDGGANSQQGNQYQMTDGGQNMEEKEPIDDDDLAISDYEADLDDEDLLIPNIANNINHEDMFVGFHELIHNNIDVQTPNYSCHSFQQGSGSRDH